MSTETSSTPPDEGHAAADNSPAASRNERSRSALSPWLYAAWVVVGTRVLFFSVAWGASFLLSTNTMGVPDQGFFEMWNRGEAREYLTVAEAGYDGRGSAQSSYALFPLYPLAIRLLGAVGIPSLAGGFIVSGLGSWVALTFLYKLAAEALDAEALDVERAGRAVLYLAVFPTAVFLVAPYSESLFLAGAIPAFYFARQRAWHFVGPFAAIAMATRFAGVFVLLGLAVEAVRQRDVKPPQRTAPLVALVVGVIPLAAYSAYLAGATGDPFYFVGAQREATSAAQLAYGVEVLAVIFGLLLVAWAMNKREWGYATYMGATLAVLLTTTLYSSLPRALLTFFPAAVLFAGWTLSRQRVHELYLAAASAAAAVGVIVFTRGAWFF